MTTLGDIEKKYRALKRFLDTHTNPLFGYTSADAAAVIAAHRAVGAEYLREALISSGSAAKLPLHTVLDPDPDPQRGIKGNPRTRAACQHFIRMFEDIQVTYAELWLTLRRK